MKHSSIQSRTWANRCRRGATAVAFVIMLPVLMLLLGFSVDLAYMQLSRAELRAATDLAAKAASSELAETGDTAKAIAKGKQIASANKVAGNGLTLQDTDFVFGNTIRSTTGKWTFTAQGSPMNAVQVNGRRTSDAPDGEVDLFFSGLLNGEGFQTVADATAGFINADICLVLDRSSSMKLAASNTATGMGGGDPRSCDIPWADSRWIALDNAIKIFLAKMNDTLAEEQVAVVTYSSNYTACDVTNQNVTLDQPLTSDFSSITSAMEVLSTTVWGGNTETSEGMSLARTELNGAGARATAEKIMVVLTDGAYTNNVHPADVAALAAGDRIKVHTITFGSCPASVISDMQDAAIAGGGYHFHAPDAATLNDAFSKIAGSISILTQ
ncbi:von Willebrand factor type A domain protein [Novipirellula galeiformis]|uniref:von Willebrand factor type A domain protein n=1 Tax=Novipirellula galeiformis TaxID=2528004 RepID=A0A5C6C369_9BACT|nr:VWA domain-containing protein [Novipirellula galeiformis]TWU17714.1 von Willebrand factor type A domain protein [Novipirellula galeiformis]